MRGQIEALERDRVTRALQEQRLVVLTLFEKPEGGRVRHALRRLALRFGFSPVGLRELAIFTRQLSVMLAAGIHIIKALETLSVSDWENRTMGTIARDLANSVREGGRLSAAFAEHPRVFAPVYVNLVRSGESSGTLIETLHRLADHLENDYKFQRQLSAALAYPAMIFTASVLLLMFLTMHVFPTFVSFFAGLSMQLPWVTRQLFVITSIFTDPLIDVALLLLAPLLFYHVVYFLRTPKGAVFRDTVVMGLPVIAQLWKASIAARFCRSAALLFECGAGQMEAMELLAGISGSPSVKAEILEARRVIRDDGASLTQALSHASFFPKLGVHLLAAGEEVGQLPDMFRRLAVWQEADVDELTARALALIEPLMLAVMGVLVGFVLVTVFMPIYTLVEAL